MLEKLLEQIQTTKFKSAVEPLFKYGMIILGMAVLSTLKAPFWMTVVLLVFAALFLGIGLSCFIYLIFYNPSLLRSEEYELKFRLMQTLGDKDKPFQLENFQNLILTDNPLQKNLPDGEALKKTENE